MVNEFGSSRVVRRVVCTRVCPCREGHGGRLDTLSSAKALLGTAFWLMVASQWTAVSALAQNSPSDKVDSPPGERIAAVDTPPADSGEAALPDLTTPVRVTDRGRVELHVADMPLSDVLQMLSIQGQRNIIASPAVEGTVTADLYDVTFDAALEAVLVANGAGYRKVGDFIYVYTEAELAELAAASAKKPYTRVFWLNYISPVDAKAYVTLIVGENEEERTVAVSPVAANSIGSSPEDSGGYASAGRDFIIVTARPDKMQEIARVLQQVDVRPQQVLIEATILRAQLTDDNALGIDFSIVGGVDLELLTARSNGLTDLVLGVLPTDRFENFNAIATTDIADDVPDGGLTVGIIKDQVAIFLRALEQVTDTTVVANPKVLALNKQKGQVIVGRRDGYLTTTVTETQAIQQVEFLETGTTLIFRPFVGNDGFIRVELHPEDSVGFVNAQGLPSEQTTEVTTNVIVRDGETILIGGLFREVTTDKRTQVPGLGSIPGIGRLFRTNTDSISREEVIILLTIKVVKDRGAYAEASFEQLEDVERIRVGLRQGLMWHGRDRLAQTHYRKALEQYAAGDTDKALWFARLALYCDGRMLAALRLREKILEQRAWDEIGTEGRDFIYHLISREQPDRRSPYPRPAISLQVPEQSVPGEDSQLDD